MISYLIRVRHLELPIILSSPEDAILIRLVREQLQQKLPQLDGTAAAVATDSRDSLGR